MYDADMNYANNQDSSHKNLKPRLCVEIETLTHDLYNTERLKPDILWNPDSVCGLGLETLSDLIFFHTHEWSYIILGRHGHNRRWWCPHPLEIYCSNYWQTYAELLVHLTNQTTILHILHSHHSSNRSQPANTLSTIKTFLGNTGSPHSFVI